MIMQFYAYCLVIFSLSVANGARILAVFQMAGQSHLSINEAIMKPLHKAGHNITFISPFPSRPPVENYTMIDSRFGQIIFVGQSIIEEFTGMSNYAMMQLLTEAGAENCNITMKIKQIQEALHSKEKLYDVLFIELLTISECYIAIAEQLGIPVIGTVTMRNWFTAGLPTNPATIPQPFANNPPLMTFAQRVYNLWTYLHVKYDELIVIPDKFHAFYSHYFPETDRLEQKVSLVFYNNHATISPRPLDPSVIEVGGIHVQPPQPLPPNIQKFIDEAEHGVILFSLGSVIRSSTLDPELRTAFVEAFAAIPQRFIWKFEGPIKGLSKNVLLLPWIPQRDILEHRNVKAFISHCGQSGFYEAVHTGTPVITMPLFADQDSNAQVLEHLGVGVRLNLKTVTRERILNAVQAIINETRYYNNMQDLSYRFKDRLMSPEESVVYWTEYVLRHNGAPHLQTAAMDMPLYQYLLLDVISAVIFGVVVLSYVILYIVRKLSLYFLKQVKVVKKD